MCYSKCFCSVLPELSWSWSRSTHAPRQLRAHMTNPSTLKSSRAWLSCWHCWNCHQEAVAGVPARLKRHPQMPRRVGGDLIAQMQESVPGWVLPGLISWSAQHGQISSCSTLSVPLDTFAQCFAVMTGCLHIFVLLASPVNSWLKAYYVFI